MSSGTQKITIFLIQVKSRPINPSNTYMRGEGTHVIINTYSIIFILPNIIHQAIIITDNSTFQSYNQRVVVTSKKIRGL